MLSLIFLTKLDNNTWCWPSVEYIAPSVEIVAGKEHITSLWARLESRHSEYSRPFILTSLSGADYLGDSGLSSLANRGMGLLNRALQVMLRLQCLDLQAEVMLGSFATGKMWHSGQSNFSMAEITKPIPCEAPLGRSCTPLIPRPPGGSPPEPPEPLPLLLLLPELPRLLC